jgi:DNA-binding NarL/FixJ family response regulator
VFIPQNTDMPHPALLIVDDHPVVANSVAAIADSVSSNIRTVIAHSLRAAMAVLERDETVVAVITDLSLPDSKGISTVEQLTQSIAATGRPIRITVFTGIEHGLLRQHCLHFGVEAFLTKNEDVRSLRTAITHLLKTDIPDAGACLDRNGAPIDAVPHNETLMDSLTPKQSAIWQDLAAGYSNPEIASRHGVGINTVKTHVKEIFERIGVRNRTEAATLFFRQQRPRE